MNPWKSTAEQLFYRALNKAVDVHEAIKNDWEEPLADLVGDVAAHQIGRAARATGQWLHTAKQVGFTNLKEYVIEEAQWLATREEIDSYAAEVNQLRADAKQLQQRIEKLIQHTP